jgi:hypothetical protein
MGYKVFLVPEAASMIFQSGSTLDLSAFTEEEQIKFQLSLMLLQISLEDSMEGIASTQKDTKPKVLLCDRGTMDGKAYVTKNVW